MKLVFRGTRGQIEARSRRHHMHTALDVEYRGRRVRIDAGDDWRGRLGEVPPGAVVVTHGHPDHARGLDAGSPAPVWASAATWRTMADYAVPESHRRTVEPRTPFAPVPNLVFEAFPVRHSINEPAVGYRIRAGRVTVFYVPDVVAIDDRADALRGCRLYIGDGATLKRSLVRRQGPHRVGHTPVYTQLGWCAKEGVPEAVFTHCGAEIVEGDERRLGSRVRRWAEERGLRTATIAHDGLERVLR